jgi:septum site-determining protein MinD
MATVVSIVSGKGGSGKSLLTAVLGRALAREGERVLLVDMDIFVRGLTVLLFGFKRPDRKEGVITTSELLGIYPENSSEKTPLPNDRSRYMIQRFLECDVLPAVDNISAPLDYDDRNLSDEKFCNECVRRFLESIQNEYDYIFIDNRAGMDSLIAATCKNAQIVLAIAEDDPVGRQTNVNLIRFLQNRGHARVVYTILNKGRRIHTYRDAKKRASDRYEFAMLGVVPFDLDVLEEFGSDQFWSSVMGTLYFRALLDAWNALAKAEPVREMSISKYRFPPGVFMQESQGRYTFLERMMRAYSVLFISAGGILWMYSIFRESGLNSFQLYAVLSMIVGAVILLISTSGFLSFLRDKARE